MREPNDIAYIVAVGVDKVDGKNYDITIQFAKPVEISGGSEGSSGGSGSGNITENITIEAPTIFTAINTANQLVSKKFEMSHAKLIVFSEEVAREGISDFMDLMSRNSEIRPNIYLAVSTCTAQKYLDSFKPMIEINPVKYYQLIYENFNSLYAPNNLSQDFYFSENSDYVDSVLPLAGIIPEKEGEENNSGGGSEGGEGAGSEKKSAGSDANPEKNMNGFEFYIPNYVPGELPKKTQNKSEVIGMALFSEDKMVGTMGAIDCEIYNMIMGTYLSSYIPYKNINNDDIINMRIEQEKKPKISVDVSSDTPKIKIKLYLEGEIVSVPNYYMEEENIEELRELVKQETQAAIGEFLYKTSQIYNKDICKFGGYAKRGFLTNDRFMQYNWKEKYKNSEFDVEIDFKIRRSGLVMRNSLNVK